MAIDACALLRIRAIDDGDPSIDLEALRRPLHRGRS